MDVVATELTSVAKPIKARALMILVIVTELVVNSPYPQSIRKERLTIKSQDINKLFLKKYINNSVNQKTA